MTADEELARLLAHDEYPVPLVIRQDFVAAVRAAGWVPLPEVEEALREALDLLRGPAHHAYGFGAWVQDRDALLARYPKENDRG